MLTITALSSAALKRTRAPGEGARSESLVLMALRSCTAGTALCRQ